MTTLDSTGCPSDFIPWCSRQTPANDIEWVADSGRKRKGSAWEAD